jgi:hypothetical protein
VSNTDNCTIYAHVCCQTEGLVHQLQGEQQTEQQQQQQHEDAAAESLQQGSNNGSCVQQQSATLVALLAQQQHGEVASDRLFTEDPDMLTDTILSR